MQAYRFEHFSRLGRVARSHVAENGAAQRFELFKALLVHRFAILQPPLAPLTEKDKTGELKATSSPVPPQASLPSQARTARK